MRETWYSVRQANDMKLRPRQQKALETKTTLLSSGFCGSGLTMITAFGNKKISQRFGIFRVGIL
jgi:hypothetical protein